MTPTQEDILRVLQPNIGLNTTAISFLLKWTDPRSGQQRVRAVSKALQSMWKEGLVRQHGRKWEITTDGQISIASEKTKAVISGLSELVRKEQLCLSSFVIHWIRSMFDENDTTGPRVAYFELLSSITDSDIARMLNTYGQRKHWSKNYLEFLGQANRQDT
jgi:hypothetical protein